MCSGVLQNFYDKLIINLKLDINTLFSLLFKLYHISGVNLRTGRIGVFPSAYAVDSDYSDWDSNYDHGRRERYLLGYLGSVETLAHKGTSVVCQAVRRVLENSGEDPDARPCILEVSDQGLRMVDRRKKDVSEIFFKFKPKKSNVNFYILGK